MKKVAVLVALFAMVIVSVAMLNVSSVEAKSLKKGEVFRTTDRRSQVIKVVSSDEIEFSDGQSTNIFLCKYTIDGDSMRVIKTMMGMATVEYYKITSDGLVEEKSGNVFYSKAGLAAEPLAKSALENGNAYYAKAQYDDAIKNYNKAISLKPNYAVAFNNRGLAYFAKGQYDNATEDYNKAISLKPDYGEAYENRNNAMRDAQFHEAISLNPADAYYYRGVSYHENKQYDRAIEDYSKAISLRPDYEAYQSRGSAYYAKSQYDKAIEDYSKAISLMPNLTHLYSNRGSAYYAKGQYDRAIEDYNWVISKYPDFAVAYNDRGDAYRKKGQNSMAIADFQKSCELGDDNGCAKVKELKAGR